MGTENQMSTEIPNYSEIIQAPVLIYNIFSSQNPQFPYEKTKPTNGGFGITLRTPDSRTGGCHNQSAGEYCSLNAAIAEHSLVMSAWGLNRSGRFLLKFSTAGLQGLTAHRHILL